MDKKSVALRKEVYQFLQHNGFKLSISQHDALSAILQSVYEYRVIESRKADDAPLRHEIVCPKCQGIKIKFKQGLKRYKKSIKLAGGTLDV